MRKEWCHPIKHNLFAVPFISFILMSFMATKWSGVSFSGDLARALFWIGSAPLNALALYTIARYSICHIWIASIVCSLYFHAKLDAGECPSVSFNACGALLLGSIHCCWHGSFPRDCKRKSYLASESCERPSWFHLYPGPKPSD